jgi:hypothetical protein
MTVAPAIALRMATANEPILDEVKPRFRGEAELGVAVPELTPLLAGAAAEVLAPATVVPNPELVRGGFVVEIVPEDVDDAEVKEVPVLDEVVVVEFVCSPMLKPPVVAKTLPTSLTSTNSTV